MASGRLLPTFCTALLFSCTVLGQSAAAEDVEIPDENLRAVIEQALGKDSGEAITDDEMATLTYLSAPYRDIADLTGLEFATNITRLYLWQNQIADLSPLSGLTPLAELYLFGNRVEDLTPLAGLTALTATGRRRR